MDQLVITQEESTKKLMDMMEHVIKSNEVTKDEAKKDHNKVMERMEKVESRMEAIEKGNNSKGESAFIANHKKSIELAKFSIKIQNMKGKVTEENVKNHMVSELNLTNDTISNMGITQAYRLGKSPEKESDPCPPTLVYFSTQEMAERILNAARSEGQSRIFKENIPEAYSEKHSEYIRAGFYLKESQNLNYRIRYEGHILQLLVKNPETKQYQVVDTYEPAIEENYCSETAAKIDLSCIAKPTEEDSKKLTIVLGKIELEEDFSPTKVPQEILDKMSPEEAKAIKGAFESNIQTKFGNKIIIICKTREDAVLLSKWKGIQEKGTYTLKPLPECLLNRDYGES